MTDTDTPPPIEQFINSPTSGIRREMSSAGGTPSATVANTTTTAASGSALGLTNNSATTTTSSNVSQTKEHHSHLQHQQRGDRERAPNPTSEREHLQPNSGGGGGGSGMREYCLRWNNHQPNLVNFFGTLLQRESFVDEGKQIHAHKLVLSACSPYFQHVFENNPCKHPIVILKDIHFSDLRTIISFVYNGEVNISQDKINSILATASTLQIKGLAEVPADELKRVGGPRASDSSINERSRTQPPPLQSSSSWGSADAEDFGHGDIPRKKLKKSASAAGPSGLSSMSTNGENTSSAGGSFESGVGASMSRSLDDGTSLALDGSVRSPVTRPGPPPLTAGSQLSQQQKSRSLDIGIERDVNIDSELSSGGFSENQTYDDSSLGAERGFELEIADVKIEAVSDDDELEFDEEFDQRPDSHEFELNESYPNYPSSSSLFHQPGRHFGSRTLGHDYDPEDVYDFEGRECSNEDKNQRLWSALEEIRNGATYRAAGRKFGFSKSHLWDILRARGLPQRRHGGAVTNSHASTSRKRAKKEPMLDYKFQDALQLVVTGRASIMRAAKLCGIPKSTLYLRLKEMGISSVVPRQNSCLNVDGLRNCKPNTEGVGGGKGRRGRLLIRQPRIKRLDNEFGRNGAELNLVEESSGGSDETMTIVATSTSQSQQPRESFKTGDENFSFSSSLARQQSIVPIVTVSESSPTPPSSPIPQPHPLVSDVTANRHTFSGGSGLGSRLMIPNVSESEDVRSHSSTSTLVKQLSQPHLPSQMSGSSIGLPRQHSTPSPSSMQATRLVYSGVKPGDLFQIVPTEGFHRKREEHDGSFLVDSSSILQIIPAGESSSGSSRVTFTSKGAMKEVEIFRRDLKRESSEGGNSESNLHSEDSLQGESLSIDESEGPLIPPLQRSGHCPALRPGPALGCNFCWNSVDKCGRILRRKTKYHCPECHINLCIVPCFQEYHEKADKKKSKGSKLLIPKPSSM